MLDPPFLCGEFYGRRCCWRQTEGAGNAMVAGTQRNVPGKRLQAFVVGRQVVGHLRTLTAPVVVIRRCLVRFGRTHATVHYTTSVALSNHWDVERAHSLKARRIS